MIQSYSDTWYDGIIAGHMFRLPLSKLGMFPLAESLPLSRAEHLFDEDGQLTSDNEWARIIDQYMPSSLGELIRSAAAFAPLRRDATTLREALCA